MCCVLLCMLATMTRVSVTKNSCFFTIFGEREQSKKACISETGSGVLRSLYVQSESFYVCSFILW